MWRRRRNLTWHTFLFYNTKAHTCNHTYSITWLLCLTAIWSLTHNLFVVVSVQVLELLKFLKPVQNIQTYFIFFCMSIQNVTVILFFFSCLLLTFICIINLFLFVRVNIYFLIFFSSIKKYIRFVIGKESR